MAPKRENMKPARALFLFCCVFALNFPHGLASENRPVVNDVTQLNPIPVNRILEPNTVDDIKLAVRNHKGPISIGGGRFSMGGQTATENALQIDMRTLNRILKLDPVERKITVQAGIRWRDIQEEIDKHNLAIKIMQTYSNFTVGGSLSVNAHGRYIGEGPLVRSVDSIKIVLADGNEVTASPTVNKDIFFAAIGGYGGIGVITEATLNLVPNEKLSRETKQLKVKDYRKYFHDNIRDNRKVVLHNGDLYPPRYEDVRLETWVRTDKPLTVNARLIPRDQKYWLEPNAISAISILPFGTELRSKVIEPLVKSKELVVWRNHEASYDVGQLEPTTPRLVFTYVLQEYFIPVDQFDAFVPRLAKIFQKHSVNVINVSIRHALPDPGTLLAWAPREVFSFVIYYKQGTTEAAKSKVGQWTRELIDEALALGGSYYLPYQIHAKPEQFKKAYPGHSQFFEIKRQKDPTNKFRNKLWDTYMN
jgi:FAD/FMN-containing dehydrogenase